LNAVNSSPTALGSTTHFTATANGSSIAYTWNFGDGQTGSGATTTYVYDALGVYTAVVTASNNISSVVATTPVTITDQPISGLTAANSSPTVVGKPTAFIAVASGTNICLCVEFWRWANRQRRKCLACLWIARRVHSRRDGQQ
jgi:PKD repeat protein